MNAKQMTDVAEAMEKLGYEIIKVKEREEDVVFPKTIEIKLVPVKSRNNNTTRINP